MKIKPVKEIKTQAEARQIAIDWQNWQSKRSMSFAEIFTWQVFFKVLASKFNLKKEFKENGII